ncbi:MAG: tetratricopeptide repeat protein [Pseudomonadales bacterium]|nr:tetratricopeptide repeat protein [Pseudomonadales bacterium]
MMTRMFSGLGCYIGWKFYSKMITLVLCVFLYSCQSDDSASSSTISGLESAFGKLTVKYPLDETLFPPDIVAPTFVWSDDTAGVVKWDIQVQFKDKEEHLRFQTQKVNWRPSETDWQSIKQRSTQAAAVVSVFGLSDSGERVSHQSLRIQTSTDPVSDSIFYREVPLPFMKAVQDPSQIRWRFGSVDSHERPPIVLDNLPVCGNCHSFSADGKTLGIDVDYGNDKGGYAILDVEKDMVLNDEKIISWSDYKRDDDEDTFGLLSQVSPDGRYVISTVKDRAVFVATPGIEFSQLFFPIKGILVVYDRENKTFKELSGADDPKYVQSNPTWSPDGKHIVFARAEVYESAAITNSTSVLLSEKDVPEFTEDNAPFKYDLYRIPFNDGKGGKAEPLAGASKNGKSNFFAKYSPDGKWIVYTQAENYMLLMPDSELYIIPAAGGEARRLRANTTRMNSWHSFSSNSRWLVFSSKQNSAYTQLFLTHIDENGNSTPPVVLDRFTAGDRAANIPEFVPVPADTITKIDEQFIDAYSFLRAGMANERSGNYPDAVTSYKKGLAVEPNNVELLNAMGFALFQQGNSDEAVAALEKALTLDPKHAKAHNNMALASIDIGELELAEAHYRESLAIEPQAAIYNDLGYVLERQGIPEDAMDAYRAALKLDPESATAHYNLATHLAREKEYKKAEEHLRIAVKSRANAKNYTGLGAVLWQQGRAVEAVAALKTAVETNPKHTGASHTLAKVYIEQGHLAKAEGIYRKLAENLPSAFAYQQLADTLTRMGKNKEAQQAQAKAKTLEAK